MIRNPIAMRLCIWSALAGLDPLAWREMSAAQWVAAVRGATTN